MNLDRYSIHAWLNNNHIVNEKGDRIDFKDHFFLFDIYRDFSPLQVGLKGAQVGWSTMANLKVFWLASNKKMDIVYTLPTDADVNTFVAGKTNRIIANNPILMEYTKDKDTIQQKQIGDSTVYWRGSWTEKAAIMITSDLNVHDEVDSSKQNIIAEYEARLQHSKFGWRWYFSHPSAPNAGVDKYWKVSDQKHWFITCGECKKEQFLNWPESIDEERKIYVCKFCNAHISDDMRRHGRWVAKYKQNDERPFSGYWIPLLICPWVSAEEILRKYNDPNNDDEFFYNKVLGLPYVGKGNKVTEDILFKNLTNDTNDQQGRIVIGLDTGLTNFYVVGNEQGLFHYGFCTGYDDIEGFMNRWPSAVLVIDAGGDLVRPRELRESIKAGYFCATTVETGKPCSW